MFSLLRWLNPWCVVGISKAACFCMLMNCVKMCKNATVAPLEERFEEEDRSFHVFLYSFKLGAYFSFLKITFWENKTVSKEPECWVQYNSCLYRCALVHKGTKDASGPAGDVKWEGCHRYAGYWWLSSRLSLSHTRLALLLLAMVLDHVGTLAGGSTDPRALLRAQI